jgi:hypothetical protein
MDIVTILRDLWRYRLLVAMVWILSLLVGTAVLYQISFPPKLETRKYAVGIATTSILIDTPSSQVVDVAPKGSDSLGIRANLLASLMVDGVVKNTIAKRAGIDPDDLVGITTSAQGEQQPADPPKDKRAPILTTRVVTDNDGSELPIIQVSAQAGDAQLAGRLASAAVSGLRDYLDSKAASQQIPDAQRLQVSGLGVARAHTTALGPKSVFAVAAVLFVFGLGCAAILGFFALVRAWQASNAHRWADEDIFPAPDDDPTAEPDPADELGFDWEEGEQAEAGVRGSRENWLTPPDRPKLVAAPPVPDADDEPQARSA